MALRASPEGLRRHAGLTDQPAGLSMEVQPAINPAREGPEDIERLQPQRFFYLRFRGKPVGDDVVQRARSSAVQLSRVSRPDGEVTGCGIGEGRERREFRRARQADQSGLGFAGPVTHSSPLT